MTGTISLSGRRDSPRSLARYLDVIGSFVTELADGVGPPREDTVKWNLPRNTSRILMFLCFIKEVTSSKLFIYVELRASVSLCFYIHFIR